MLRSGSAGTSAVCHSLPQTMGILENVAALYGFPAYPHSVNSMINDQFKALSSERRRDVLLTLLDQQDRVDPPSEYEQIEIDGGEDLSAISMQHVHLPMLEDCGYIEWDKESQSVSKGPQFDELEPLLTVLEENEAVIRCE